MCLGREINMIPTFALNEEYHKSVDRLKNKSKGIFGFSIKSQSNSITKKSYYLELKSQLYFQN